MGLDAETPPKEDWLKKAVNMGCQAPLSEDPMSALLGEMLIVAPYKAPEKKKDKNPTKGAREGLHQRVSPDTKSRDTLAPSTQEGDQEEEEEEEEESNYSRPRKRAVPAEAKGERPSPAPKNRDKGKLVLLDDSLDSDKESAASEKVPEKVPRVKPHTESLLRDLPMTRCLRTLPRQLTWQRVEAHRVPHPLRPLMSPEKCCPRGLRPCRTPGRGGGDITMAEVNTSAAEDKEKELEQVKPSQTTAPAPIRPPEASQTSPSEGGAGAPPSAPNTGSRVTVEWPDMLVEDVKSSSIAAEYRTLMDAASALAAAVNAAKLAEMNRKLKVSDEELDLVNKRYDEARATAAEVESLKAELLQAKKAAAEQATAALASVKTEREKNEARVA
nr:uncharacterized protein LOC109786477 [Aegilops tauschii subsp. strangulata]